MKKHTLILWLGLGFFFGYMFGMTMDPLDRAVRKAQNINKNTLAGFSTLRAGEKSFEQQLQEDPKKMNQYVKAVSENILNKEKAINVLDDANAFIDLATKKTFIDNSLQKYLMSLGSIQLQHGMVYEAITNLKRAFEINPYDAATVQYLGLSYLGLYQVLPSGSEKNITGDEALKFLQIGIKINPENQDALYGLALIYTDQGLYDKALPYFSRLLELNPSNIDALLGAARIYYDNGDLDKARRIYEQSESIILNQQRQTGLLRKPVTQGNAQLKLDTIRKNLEIIYQDLGRIRG